MVVLESAPYQLIHARQEGRQGFAGSGGRRDQDVFARTDARPAGQLRFGGCTEPFAEPAANERMERIEHVMHGPTAYQS